MIAQLTARWLHLAFIAVLVCGCAAPVAEPRAVSRADRASFDTQIHALLLRDCGFHACHGSTARFFQVFGPGHGRLDTTTRPLDDLTPQELELSYTRALSMIDARDPAHSELLLKPLAVAAGGQGHEGIDGLGRNVYESKDDPSFRILSTWVMTGATP